MSSHCSTNACSKNLYFICLCTHVSMQIKVCKAKMIKKLLEPKRNKKLEAKESYARILGKTKSGVFQKNCTQSRLDYPSASRGGRVPSMQYRNACCQLVRPRVISPKSGKISLSLPSQQLCISSLVMRGACGDLAGPGETQAIILRRLWESQGQFCLSVYGTPVWECPFLMPRCGQTRCSSDSCKPQVLCFQLRQ